MEKEKEYLSKFIYWKATALSLLGDGASLKDADQLLKTAGFGCGGDFWLL